MAGGTSRSSISIDISIINDPAFGISPFMETPIQVQIIAQQPAEVESCEVFHVLVRSAAVLCSRRLMAYGSSPSFSIIIHPILRF